MLENENLSGRLTKLYVCITVTSLCKIIQEHTGANFVVAYSMWGKSNTQGGKHAWCEVCDLEDVLGPGIRSAYLVPRNRLANDPIYEAYRGHLSVCDSGPEYLDLLRACAMHLPIGVGQGNSPIASSNLLSFDACAALECETSLAFKAIRLAVLRSCSRLAGFASRPAVDTTYYKIRFEPGLESLMVRDRNFVEFLK